MPAVVAPKSKSRRKNHFNRESFVQRVQILCCVLGILCLLIAGLMAALGAFQDNRQASAGLLRLATVYAAAGAFCFLVRFFVYTIPQWRNMRASPTYLRRQKLSTRRRKRESDEAKQPAPVSAEQDGADPRSGGVLLLVLILLGLVATLVVQSQLLARDRLHREQRNLRVAEVRRAANDAARAALQRVADDPDLQADYSNETWAVHEELTTPLGISTRVRVDDEDRLFDLNNLRLPVAAGVRRPDDIVMDIMTLCGNYTPAIQVGSLTDFMDSDDSGSHESDLYRKRQPPYACPNRMLYGWGEVASADGWSHEMFDRHARSRLPGTFDGNLVDCVTVLPVPREHPLSVNVNTASREALTGVLGIDHDNLVTTILTLRSLKPIRNLDTLALLSEPGYFESVRPYLDVRSHVFRVEARAYAEGHTEVLRVLASRDSDGRVDILQWLF